MDYRARANSGAAMEGVSRRIHVCAQIRLLHVRARHGCAPQIAGALSSRRECIVAPAVSNSDSQGKHPGKMGSCDVRLDRSPANDVAFLERAEFAIKSPAFGCETCGNCVLPDMQYVCPQTCPKQLRNGPCGGTNNGQCEVIPERPC